MGNVSRETRSVSKAFWGFFVFTILISACDEDAIKEDISVFNKMIEFNHDMKSPKEVMILYYEHLPGERETDYSLTEETLTKGRFRVTLTRTQLKDDSMEGERFVMIVKHDGIKWKVITVERSWRCYNGRGHTDWGIEPCG